MSVCYKHFLAVFATIIISFLHYLSICPSVCLCLSIYLSIYLFIFLRSIYLIIYLSIYLFKIYISNIYLSIYLSVSIYLSMFSSQLAVPSTLISPQPFKACPRYGHSEKKPWLLISITATKMSTHRDGIFT